MIEFAAHMQAVHACRACPTVEGLPVTGGVADAKVILVGQAPGPREHDAGKPFAWTAGTRLFDWFGSIGVDEERFRSRVHICAAARCFPGRTPDGRSDRPPSSQEVARCSHWLDEEMLLLRPELVIAVGRFAIELFMKCPKLDAVIGRVHRVERATHDLDLVAIPHPSGRSTWLNKPVHQVLLDQALASIASHPAWKRTVVS